MFAGCLMPEVTVRGGIRRMSGLLPASVAVTVSSSSLPLRPGSNLKALTRKCLWVGPVERERERERERV